MLCPFYQNKQLLLHTLSYVWDVGQSLCADVVIRQLIANFIPVVALRSMGVITLVNSICTFYLPWEHLGVQQSLHREPTVANHGVLEAGRSLTDPVPLVLNGILLHPSLEALPQTAIAALVPLVFVHRAVARKPAAVCMLLSDASPEKSFAAVARSCSVMFSCSAVSTDGAVCRNNPTLQMMTIIHLCVLNYSVSNHFQFHPLYGVYLRSIHVVEIYWRVWLVQVSDIITMLVYQTERGKIEKPNRKAKLSYLDQHTLALCR